MTNAAPATSGPRRQLTLFDSTCIIIGIIIGAGIYQTTPLIAANATGPGAWLYQLVFQAAYGRSVVPLVPVSIVGPPSLMMVWLLGGGIALVGSICYAELTTRFPRDGGDYVYLTTHYGQPIGFLFVWCEFWIIRPCSIGAMAYVFAGYASQLSPWPIHHAGQLLVACGAILLLSATNILGVRTGKTAQNFLTVFKVAGLIAIFLVAMFISRSADAPAGPALYVGQSSFRLAIIMVLFTYGGWNDMAFVAAEVENPQRNLLRALVTGAIAVTVIYVMVNIAFVQGLGYAATSNSPAVAADLLNAAFPGWGGKLISLLICVSCLGAINGMVLTGARIFYAMGAEKPSFAWFGRWSAKLDSPMRSLAAQALVTMAVVIAFGLYSNSNQSGFERLVVFSSPLFWLFFLLSSISLFIFRLRRSQPEQASYQVCFFPVTPILFSLACVFMLYSSITYAIGTGFWEGYVALAILTLGLVVGLVEPLVRRGSKNNPADKSS